MSRPPMVAVIGRKHSGKTTATVRLAAELRRRGHRVMIIKHGSHTFNLDPQGTDTYRHYHEGGAEKVAMVAPDKFALVERWSEELGPEEIATRYMSEASVVLCEGFKGSSLPRIEVYRRAAHAEPLYAPNEPTAPLYRAMLTDVAGLRLPFPVISLDDPDWVSTLAALVERDIMGLS